MTIQIASADEKTIETINNALTVHADSSKIVVIIDLDHLTDAQESMLETDGLFFSSINDQWMTKTKSQVMITSDKVLKSNQIIVEFEL